MTDSLLPVGLHFGLPEDLYHADPGLGSTSLKAIASNPIDFQWSRLFDEDKDTPSKLLGSALHCRVLDGLDVFEEAYAVPPGQDEFDELLVTKDDLINRCKALDIDVLSKDTKATLRKKLKLANDRIPVWDEIMERFNEAYADSQQITHKMWKTVETAAYWMQEHEKLGPVMRNGSFAHGAPEVSYIYQWEDVRLKIRLDYVYHNLIVDLKTYAPWSSEPIPKQIIKTVMNWRYDLQAAAYLRGLNDAYDQYHGGTLQVHGDEPYKGFVDKLFSTTDFNWYWVMVRSQGAPAPTVVELDHQSFVLGSARDSIEQAIQTYRYYRDQFGDDRPWSAPSDIITLTDEDFPAYFGL